MYVSQHTVVHHVAGNILLSKKNVFIPTLDRENVENVLGWVKVSGYRVRLAYQDDNTANISWRVITCDGDHINSPRSPHSHDWPLPSPTFAIATTSPHEMVYHTIVEIGRAHV